MSASERPDGWYWVRNIWKGKPGPWQAALYVMGEWTLKVSWDEIGLRIPSPDEQPPPDLCREAFAWLYQWAGAINAPMSVLDNLSALAQGNAAPHQWKYPAMPDEQSAPRDAAHIKNVSEYLAGLDESRDAAPCPVSAESLRVIAKHLEDRGLFTSALAILTLIDWLEAREAQK
jgi:hypothetical protein